MAQRGRKGQFKGSIVPLQVVAESTIPPPEDLSPPEAAAWERVMRGMRGNWFNTACIDLLRCYCAVAMLCERQAERLRTLPIEDPEHTKALRALNHTSKTLATLATRLRITPHSNQRGKPQGFDEGQGLKKPWE